jgi:hypothetical protein
MAQENCNRMVEEVLHEIMHDPVFRPPLPDLIEQARDSEKYLQAYINTILHQQQRHGIIVGSPGVGKSYSLSSMLKTAGLKEGQVQDRGRYDYTIVKGSISERTFHETLFWHSRNGKFLILDDCTSAERDPEVMGMLNAAMDSTNPVVTRASVRTYYSNGIEIPNSFQFNGSIIILSNMFSRERANTIRGSHRHNRIESITDRTIPFTLGNDDVYSVFAQMVLIGVEQGYLFDQGLSEDEVRDTMLWMMSNLKNFKQVSMRMFVWLAKTRKSTLLLGIDWQDYAARLLLKDGVW